MKFGFIRGFLGLSFLGALLAFQNCSNAKFTNETRNLSLLGSGDFGEDGSCGATTVGSQKIVKVLFLVDTSGSNGIENRGEPTDPKKTWRANVLNGFINTYSAKSNFYFGLVTFQGNFTTPQIRVNNRPIFSNNSSLVQNGIGNFMATTDTGGTPYKAALGAAKALIQEDLSANAVQKASYVVMMVSDGSPSDYKNPDEIIPDIAAIKNLAPSQISLNSVYYYSSVLPQEQTRYMKNISGLGGGAFVIANSNQSLNIDDVIRVPSVGCQ